MNGDKFQDVISGGDVNRNWTDDLPICAQTGRQH